MATAVYIIMGVSGSGKSSVGQALAARLDCPFYDGDDFHPLENVAKMASGISLEDADRAPWLARLADLIGEQEKRGETAVLACSALKKRYRDQLRAGHKAVVFVYLRGDYALIWQRMQQRAAHYMKAEMLNSQFATLEEPDTTEVDVLTVSASQSVGAIVTQILSKG